MDNVITYDLVLNRHFHANMDTIMIQRCGQSEYRIKYNIAKHPIGKNQHPSTFHFILKWFYHLGLTYY